MMITLARGNILNAETQAVINTVNTKGIMGKGIALQFKKAYPNMFKAYAKACKEGKVAIGKMFVWENDTMFGPSYIINFPTKEDWRKPSKIQYIQDGLQDLVEVIRKYKITSIAVPPLGCGNGGLDWREVKPLIISALEKLPEVKAVLYEPSESREQYQRETDIASQKMTISRALIIKVLQQYCVLGYELTLLEIQKLLYFLQELGEPLKLRYVKYLYGPYADNLRHVLSAFEGVYTKGFGDGTRNKPDVVIHILPQAIAAADDYLSKNALAYEESIKRLDLVKQLIEGFETPYGMELLATVHWLIKKENIDTKNDEKLISAVHRWNPRKAAIMKPAHIQKAAQRIEQFFTILGIG